MWLAFLLTSVAQSPVAKPVEQVSARGAHCEIVAHFAVQRAADDALAAAEAAIPFAESIFGALDAKLAEPLRIHVYATAADYLAVEDKLTHGAFARNLSFTSDVTKEAYVALQPEMSGAAFAVTGLSLQTRMIVAHETAHVVCHRLWPNAPSQPFWFAEGAALWVAEEACRARGWMPDPMQFPLTSTNALRCRARLAAQSLPDALIIMNGLPGGLTFDERYAVSGAIFRYLKSAPRQPLLARIVDAARRAGGGTDIQATISHALSKVIAAEDARTEFQTGFETSVRETKPEWDETYRALWPVGDVWAQAAFATTNAIAWRTQDAASDHYEISGELSILHGSNHQMNLLLARTEHSFVQVSFTAAFGVDVFEFDSTRGPEKAWNKLATVELKSIYEEQYAAFKVVVEDQTVTVFIGEKPVCAPQIEGHPMQGAWGLGALAGSVGLWRKLAFKAL